MYYLGVVDNYTYREEICKLLITDHQTWEKLLSYHDPIFEVRKFPQKCVIRDISNYTLLFRFYHIPLN